MGGFGSGRNEYARTPTVEQCRHLNVNKFTDVVEHTGRGSMVYWGGEDDPEASIRVLMLGPDHVDALAGGETLQVRHPDDDPADATEATVDVPAPARDGPDDVDDDRAVALLLTYRVTDHRADETRDVRYIVPFDYTECHFGGSRAWFRCPGPGGRWCGERVGKLYCPPRGDRYLCRHCHDLGYQSSRSSGNELERAEQRYRKAFAKADAENRRPHPNNEPYFPERPKGMHHDTFRDLADDVQAARREWSAAMETRMEALTETYADLAGVPSLV